jgi:hypothetical protein
MTHRSNRKIIRFAVDPNEGGELLGHVSPDLPMKTITPSSQDKPRLQ